MMILECYTLMGMAVYEHLKRQKIVETSNKN